MGRHLQFVSVKNLVVSLMVAMAILGWPSSVAAEGASSQHITVTPATSNIEADPGQQKTGTMTVVNQGSDSFSVKLSVTPYSVKGLDYEPQYVVGDAEKADPSKWVSLSTYGTDELQPTKLLEVTYTVNIPSDASPGGHYFVIFAESSPLSTGSGVTAHNRVGQVVYVNVSGDVVRTGEASLPALPSVVTATTTKLPINIKNTGNTHFASNVKVTVKDFFGNVVFNAEQERYILPGTERQITYDWTDYTPFGIYNVERSASLPDGTTVSGTSTVVVLNPLLAGAVVVVILMVVGIIILQRRRR